MGVVIIKNPSYKIENDVRSWLNSKGYNFHYTYVFDGFYSSLFQRVSDEDLNEFKEKFGTDLTLMGISFNRLGEKSKFKYYCCPSALSKFKSSVSVWLKYNKFPFYSATITDKISLICNEKLSEDQINDFEKEFEVKLGECKMSCDSKDMTYVFY